MQNAQRRVTKEVFCFLIRKLVGNQKINAEKETLVRESDRNTASPTESAVCGK